MPMTMILINLLLGRISNMKTIKKIVFFIAIFSIIFCTVITYRIEKRNEQINILEVELTKTLNIAKRGDIIQKTIPPKGMLILAIYDDLNKYDTIEDVWSAVGTWNGTMLLHSYKTGKEIITYCVSNDAPLGWIPLPSDFDKIYEEARR